LRKKPLRKNRAKSKMSRHPDRYRGFATVFSAVFESESSIMPHLTFWSFFVKKKGRTKVI